MQHTNATLRRAFWAMGIKDRPQAFEVCPYPDRWIVREGMRYHLTPALCGRNKWRVEYSIAPIYGDEKSAYAVGVSFTVKGHRAKSKAWRARRLARVSLLASLLPRKGA